jgi:hypothetical protein
MRLLVTSLIPRHVMRYFWAFPIDHPCLGRGAFNALLYSVHWDNQGKRQFTRTVHKSAECEVLMKKKYDSMLS